MNKLLQILLLICIPATLTTAQVNLTNGLVAYYPFNGSFNDASGTGNHGTGINGVTFGTDQWGNANSAASFDGVDDWISVPASASLTPGHHLSIALRFKTNSNALQLLVSKSDYAGSNSPNSMQYQVGFNAGGVLPNNGLLFSTCHTNTCITSTGFATHYTYGSQVGNNQWYCIVVTFDNGVKKVFMNGSLISTSTISGTANNTSIDSCINGTLRMGVWWQNDPRYFSGLMDEVRIWNRTINQQEIDSLCNLKSVPGDTIINKYAAITGRGDCDNSFIVDTATGFAAGDTVLMIQMKGAGIDSSNSANFGSVSAYDGAGNYELNVVSSVAGNNIALRYGLRRTYDIPHGRVQLVRVPSFATYTVGQLHTCMPWTGAKGGVFMINVAGTLTLNDVIDVSGRGFRGGNINNATTYTCDKTDYYYPLSGNDGGMKGEGIAELSALRMAGKGKLANGGGGGNNANAGGGGGSNGGVGGAGGRQFEYCNQSLTSGGVGGVALMHGASNNRLYLGGGGGAGHENNGNTDPGGNGGGIVIIQAGSITGSGRYIRANGFNCSNTNAANTTGVPGDGQSGGGAGGSVLLKVAGFTGAPYIESKGGAGGNMYSLGVHGPGGGGGGGSLGFVNATIPAANINTAGGANGTMVNKGNGAQFAQPGQSGVTVSGIAFVMPTALFVPSIFNLSFTDSLLSCVSRQMINTSTAGVGIASYQWIFDSTISTQTNPVLTFPGSGTYPVKLIVTDSNGCRDSLVKNITINYSRFANAGPDTSICLGASASLGASGGLEYVWTPATGLSHPLMPVTTATPTQTTTYTVTVTDTLGCVDRDSVEVAVNFPPLVDAYAIGEPISCNNSSVQLQAQGTLHYIWSPGKYCSDSTSASPIVTPLETTLFTVEGTDEKGCSSTDTITILSAKDAAVFIPNAFTPNNDGRNDLFRPIVFCDFSMEEFRVFNRWGREVFYGYTNKHAWDGSLKGKPAELGVYFYFIRGRKKSTGEEVFYKGTINLIR